MARGRIPCSDMTREEAINKTVFVFTHDGEIEETTLYDHVMESKDETTSPVGVMGRIHIRHEDYSCDYGLLNSTINREGKYEAWTWGVHGNNPRFLEEFETEPEAEEYLWEKVYYYDFQQDDQRDTSWFETREEAEKLKLEREQ